MLTIRLPATLSELETYRTWVADEWGDAPALEAPADDPAVPAPLLALRKAALIGGLSFTWYPKPQTPDKGLWINTLLVHPAWRGQGVARQLIAAAEAQARSVPVVELWVYTALPRLYQGCGWTPIRETADGRTVLHKAV